MCDPITIGIGLAAAGSLAQYVGGRQAKNAVNNALLTEHNRQDQMTKQQDELLNKSYSSAKKLTDPNAEKEAADKRTAAYMEALAARPSDQAYLPGQNSGPQVVQDAASAAAAKQDAYSAQQAAALANLNGFDDQMLGTRINLGRNGQGIGQIGSNKYNSANVLNSELTAAQYKGKTLRDLGGLAQMIGTSMLGGHLLSGAGGAGAGVTSPSVLEAGAISLPSVPIDLLPNIPLSVT